MATRSSTMVLCVLLLAVGGAPGCKPELLPNSNVENTAENKEVAAVLEQYRQALQTVDRDHPEDAEVRTNAVLRLVSDDYIEDNGTSDPSDDYNFEGLRQHLKDDLAKVRSIKMEIHLLRVDVDGDRAWADYRFQLRSWVEFPSGGQWITKTDDNRLTLRRERGRYKILSGL